MSRNNRRNREEKKRRAPKTRPKRTAKKSSVYITLPSSLNDEIGKFSRSIVLGASPVFVEVLASPGAIPNDCFNNVINQVKKFGGEVVYGWNVMEWPGVLLEAEFHAIWRKPTGELLDVSPREDGEPKILFIEDPENVYDGKMMISHQMALENSPPEAQSYINASQSLLKFRAARYVDDGKNGAVSVSQKDWSHLRILQADFVSARQRLIAATAKKPLR